jgi:hypothetical protein
MSSITLLYHHNGDREDMYDDDAGGTNHIEIELYVDVSSRFKRVMSRNNYEQIRGTMVQYNTLYLVGHLMSHGLPI